MIRIVRLDEHPCLLETPAIQWRPKGGIKIDE
jgi:hypothetical protein